jgi:hypothetical protein
MKLLYKGVFLLSAGIVLLAAISAITPSTVRAAIATLVQNVDEPGRNPYHQTVTVIQNVFHCPNGGFCEAFFPAVPTGKRLVVTYASATYFLSAGGVEQNVFIGADGDLFDDVQYLPAPTNIGGNKVVTGAPITYYVDVGHLPSLFLAGNVDTSNRFGAVATIAGYLVSVP